MQHQRTNHINQKPEKIALTFERNPALCRTLKEHESYGKEIKTQSDKITKMKSEDADFHDIKQQVSLFFYISISGSSVCRSISGRKKHVLICHCYPSQLLSTLSVPSMLLPQKHTARSSLHRFTLCAACVPET
jgi:hypothetical protein